MYYCQDYWELEGYMPEFEKQQQRTLAG